jgi:hypothetical protein
MYARLLLFLMAVPIACLPAGVYKSVGPDGRIQYTDRPVSGAEPVRVTRDRARSQAAALKPATETAAELGPYTAFEIASPAPGATVRSETGDLPVSLLLDPALMAAHKLRVMLDGQSVPGAVSGTQLTLKGLAYGSHRLQAQVLDDLDVPVAYTPAIDFHLRKPVPESALP